MRAIGRDALLPGCLIAGLAGLVIAAALATLGDPHAPGASARMAGQGVAQERPPQAPPDLAPVAAEIIRLQAAAAGEHARLEALREAQQRLTAALDGLWREVTDLEAQRDGLLEDLAELRAQAACDLSEEPCRAPATLPDRPLVGIAFLADPAQPPPAPTSVTVHYRARSGAAREAAELVAEEARRAGFGPVALRPVPQVPPRRTLRTPGEEGRAEAERLVARLQARWRHPWSVEPGAESARMAGLEIWMPH